MYQLTSLAVSLLGKNEGDSENAFGRRTFILHKRGQVKVLLVCLVDLSVSSGFGKGLQRVLQQSPRSHGLFPSCMASIYV